MPQVGLYSELKKIYVIGSVCYLWISFQDEEEALPNVCLQKDSFSQSRTMSKNPGKSKAGQRRAEATAHRAPATTALPYLEDDVCFLPRGLCTLIPVTCSSISPDIQMVDLLSLHSGLSSSGPSLPALSARSSFPFIPQQWPHLVSFLASPMS